MLHALSMESMLPSKALSSDVSQEGYDYEFVPSAEKYECPICLLCIRDPHLTECGHRFCNNCIRKWLRDEDRGKKCPNCNELLSELQVYPDNFTKREILSLLVKCPYADQGCLLTVELKKIEAHKASCEYEQVPCPQGCSARLRKKDMGTHLQKDCCHRIVSCPHCSLAMAVGRLEGHMTECDLASTNCQNCQLVLTRQQINRHLQTDCPKALVKCLFHRFGCEELLPRTDIQQHNVQQTQLHLRLLALTMDSIIRANPELQSIGSHDSSALSSWLVGETALPEVYVSSSSNGDDATIVGSHRADSVQQPLNLLIPPPEQRLAHVQPMVTPGSTKADDHSVAEAMRRRFQHTEAVASSCSLSDCDDALPPSISSSQPSQKHSSQLPRPLISATMSYAGSFDDKSGYGKGGGDGLGLCDGGSDSDLKKEKYVGSGECSGGLSAADASLQSASEAHRIRELERESAMQRQYVFEMKAKLSASEKLLQGTQTQLADLEGRLCGGTYVWKLRGYAKLRVPSGGSASAAAMAGAASPGILHSPGFYTSFYGYKFCMRVNVNGMDGGQGTHLSLFVHLMQSDNDDLLTWPFQGKITLTVLDQSEAPGTTRNHITETLLAKPSLAAFQRPTALRNHKGFGYLEFAPFSYLENAPFVKNDTLLIRADVKPS